MPKTYPMHKVLGEEARIIIPSQLIGAAEAAEILGLERSTLTRWIHARKIQPLAQLDGKRGAYVFDRADVVSLSQGKAA
jgi:excisionase family DNA binding protein